MYAIRSYYDPANTIAENYGVLAGNYEYNDNGEITRITSYNVCYTKLLRKTVS